MPTLGQKNLHAMLRGQQWVLLMTNSCAAETWFASLSMLCGPQGLCRELWN